MLFKNEMRYATAIARTGQMSIVHSCVNWLFFFCTVIVKRPWAWKRRYIN